jgi:alkanesulfonate monooxygenase
MIGVDPPKGNTLHVISGGISPGFLAEFSQAHEDAGFELVLGGDYSSSSEGFGVASYMNDFRRRVAAQGRPAPGFNMSFRPIIAPTEGQAWDKAAKVLKDLKDGGALPTRALDASAERLVEIASRADVHDERLWMPVAALAGGRGNSTCLVGTPEQVAEAMLKYYRLGIHSFLIRGFDPVGDVTEYGRELIPRLKLGAQEMDAQGAGK